MNRLYLILKGPGRPAAGALVVAAALLAPGCARVLGPVSKPVAQVRGRLHEGGRPISGGWIEFMPSGGTIGNLRSARIGADGTFDADRVAVGENAIRVVNGHVDDTPYLKILGQTVSPIRRVIRLDDRTPLSIDLRDEALRFHETRRRQAAAVTGEETGDHRP
ncbi:MAG: hypothetical protein ACYC61_23505 [Isosphaeraceae bacterium]